MARSKGTKPVVQANGSEAQLAVPVSYVGSDPYAIDASNRMLLPSDWREPGSPSQFFVTLVSSGDFLVIRPPEAFHAYLNKVRESTADKAALAQAERDLSDRVRRVSLDRFGRLPLPSDLLSRAGIQGQGQLVGRFSFFEIWPIARYQGTEPDRKSAAEAVLKQHENA